MYFSDGLHDRWRETRVEWQWGEFVSPADQRHHGILNYLCFTLLEQWVCWLGRASRLKNWLISTLKDHLQPLSIWGEKLNGLEVPAAFLSEPKQPPLAAFYPYRWSSRGQLSFSSGVGQNGEPSAFTCRDNIHSRQSRAGGREEKKKKDGIGDGDKLGGCEGLMAGWGGICDQLYLHDS